MAAEFARLPVKVGGAHDVFLQDQWDQKLLKNDPGCGGRFIAVERGRVCHNFAVSAQAVGINLEDDEVSALLAAQAGLKKMDIGEIQNRELNAFDLHVFSPRFDVTI
jgi:hypothetical protein